MRHEASARLVTDYDVNNAYQYIINREETHVSWLQHALIDLGAEIPDDPPPPTIKRSRKDKNAVIELSADDGKGNREFVQKWRDRIEQAAEGRTDLTGKPMEIHTRRGKVLATRWIE